jgi:hypothetical protein
MLKEAFGDDALGQTQTYEWCVSRTEGYQSMMKSILGDLRPEPRPKPWQKFDVEGITHHIYVPPRQKMNGKFCYEVLRRLRSNHPAQTSRQVA